MGWGIRLLRGALAAFLLLAFGLVGCGTEDGPGGERAGGAPVFVEEMPALAPVTLDEGERLRVVATTSIVADVVYSVGGELIDLETLLPLGTDPHDFVPTPQDVAAVADAHVLFSNGAGLETFLENLLEGVGGHVAVVPLSYGVALLDYGEENGGRAHGGADPHTWFDPHNVIVWTRNAERALSALDPANARAYGANARAYEAKLKALDTWIREQVAQVPEANRRLVTDHASFRYFAQRYGFEQVGAIFPGYSTLAEPSAQDLAELEDAIRTFGVRAVFVGSTVSPGLAERVAEDTGTRLVFLYTGSLSEPSGPAGDYVSLMEYDVNAIVEALR